MTAHLLKRLLLIFVVVFTAQSLAMSVNPVSCGMDNIGVYDASHHLAFDTNSVQTDTNPTSLNDCSTSVHCALCFIILPSDINLQMVAIDRQINPEAMLPWHSLSPQPELPPPLF